MRSEIHQQKEQTTPSQGADKYKLIGKKLLPVGIAMAVCCSIVGGAWFGLNAARTALHVPTVELPTLAQSKAGIQLYDRHDKFICTVFPDMDKDPVALSKVSINMRNAVLAAEDHNFYKHHGLDFGGIVRAALVNYKQHRTAQGASTITQQLARNLYLDKGDRSLKRKAREAFIAWDLESKYSKSKILETYLNEIYFGGGVHGIERAAEHYFNKHASQLSVSESAYLAGLIRCPSMLGTQTNRQIALARRDVIINQMAQYGYITQAQAQQSHLSVLAFKVGPHRFHYPHYIAYAMEEVSKNIDPDLQKHGCKVYTNLDPKVQQMAVKEMNDGIKHAPRGINQGALVTISLKDGAILAMVGGVGDFANNEWNRATHGHTAGSSFKPFVYLTGLTKGVLQKDSIIDDAPYTIEAAGTTPYSPRNFDGRYKGWMTTRDALSQSRNVCSVRVAQASGIDSVIETAHMAGIKSQLDAYPSLALGSCAVSPLEMANAYATLARYGAYMPATTLRRIETNDGKLVRDFTSGASQNLPADKVAQLVDVMQDVVRHGTGTAAALRGIAVAGKTGTADKGKDLWFVGFTPDTVTAVWGGSDLNRPIAGSNVTGGTVMAHIWQRYMTDFYSVNKPTAVAFTAPSEPLIASVPAGDYSALVSADPSADPASLDDAGKIAQQAKINGIGSASELQKVSMIRRQQQQQIALAHEQSLQSAYQEQQLQQPADFGQQQSPAVAAQPTTYSYVRRVEPAPQVNVLEGSDAVQTVSSTTLVYQ